RRGRGPQCGSAALAYLKPSHTPEALQARQPNGIRQSASSSLIRVTTVPFGTLVLILSRPENRALCCEPWSCRGIGGIVVPIIHPLLVREHAGTRGECRRAGTICGHLAARSTQDG